MKLIKIYLRLSLSIGFFSAVADRFGFWSLKNSVWGNWTNFLNYTRQINPLFSEKLIEPIGIIITIVEVLLAIFLIIGFKTEIFARLSGYLILIFALSMSFSTGIKGAIDYSVFTAAGASFALANIKEKFLELDLIFKNKNITNSC